MIENLYKKDSVINIAIFASGTGTNAEKIIKEFKNDPYIRVKLIIANKAEAGVLQIAENNNISARVINNKELNSNEFGEELRKEGIDFIVLAGFLLKIPEGLVNLYSGNIINIHPALLPKHGGKGMYGGFVHQAVIESGAGNSGITIHLVDDKYDNGKILFQASCLVEPGDTPEVLANKIHTLEHLHFSKVIKSHISYLRKLSA